jgi:hypothetical protein
LAAPDNESGATALILSAEQQRQSKKADSTGRKAMNTASQSRDYFLLPLSVANVTHHANANHHGNIVHHFKIIT